MDGSMAVGPGSVNSSSDFVRKLYKMLEDPTYSKTVRWGDEGNSFVVLENEKFTKSILPKHFKHSNFASFVRQLNKYDFHKVRQNNEDNGQSPYGPGAWEFRHPEFKANNKDSLDNIRRKAPAPRKPTQVLDESGPTQQMDMVNSQLVATQQQLQQLQDRYNEMSLHHSMLVQELISVQKQVVGHDHVMQMVMSFLHSVDARQRRDSKQGLDFPGNSGTSPNVDHGPQQISPLEDEPASSLQNASRLLSDLNADTRLNSQKLENISEMQNRTNGAITTPPPDAAGRAGQTRPPTSATSSTSLGYSKLHHGDSDAVVYPVGQQNGIDPMYAEHINNIPYSLPPKDEHLEQRRPPILDTRKKSTSMDPGWLRQPEILLVEDDPTCRRIGSKFLLSFQCRIDSALDGLEAVNKMNHGSRYDLVLMDIIMPNLDGVSATHMIRQFDQTPIIAMTSNIRSDDISMYFNHGMNDVLPKPFTKEGLLNMLEKHLGHLKKIPEGMDHAPQHPGITNIQTSAAQSTKEEPSPHESPSATGNWQSSAQFNGLSPTNSLPSQQFAAPMAPPGAYGMETSPMQYQAPPTPLSAPARQQHHRRRVSDFGDGEDLPNDSKRQRIYPQQVPMTLNQMHRHP